MEIVVPPPSVVLYIAIGMPCLVILLMLLAARGKPLLPKLLAAGIAFLVGGIVLFFGYKSARFSWDDAGIHDGTFGAPRDITWTEIRDVEMVPGFWQSAYRPTLRTNGSAYANFRAGYFQLANGSTARVFILTETQDALVVHTATETYLFAPSPFDPFVEAMRAHTGKPAL